MFEIKDLILNPQNAKRRSLRIDWSSVERAEQLTREVEGQQYEISRIALTMSVQMPNNDTDTSEGRAYVIHPVPDGAEILPVVQALIGGRLSEQGFTAGNNGSGWWELVTTVDGDEEREELNVIVFAQYPNAHVA